MKTRDEILLDSEATAVKFPDFITIWPYISQKYMTNNKTCAYHYTDISGFMGILSDRCFWASNIHFQNDNAEYKDGLSACLSLIDELSATPNNSLEKEYLSNLGQSLKDEYALAIAGQISSKDIFTISFCNNGDLLSQWRGYGGVAGISIGIDEATLLEKTRFKEATLYEKEKLPYPKHERVAELSKVIYDDSVKRNIIQDIIAVGSKHISFRQNAHDQYPCIYLEQAVSGVSSYLYRLFPLLKDNGFSEEQELRYVEQLTKNSNTHVDFRERNGILLPYVKFKWLDVNCQPLERLPIVDIIVGPTTQQMLLIDSVKYFLKNSGFDYLVDKVRASLIPYRG